MNKAIENKTYNKETGKFNNQSRYISYDLNKVVFHTEIDTQISNILYKIHKFENF